MPAIKITIIALNVIPQLKLKKFDAQLPQDDEDADLRKIELEEKQCVYEFLTAKEGLMPQVKEFPSDESFSNDYKVSFICVRHVIYEVMPLIKDFPSDESFSIDY